jgi:hypothetical protein
MWKTGALAAVVAAGTALVAVNTATAAENTRGQIVSVKRLRVLSDAKVTKKLTDAGFDASSVRYGVRTYRLTYRTIDAMRRPTTATGLLAVPVDGPRRATMVSYTHGTELYRGDAPSMSPSGFEPAPAYTYASAGFVAAAPDYLGLGTGPGRHPWMDIPSETTASLDMLRAARTYADGHGFTVRKKVMVTGFSQGASAALGLGRALQNGADRNFELGGLAPVSGAYDFTHAELPAVLDGELARLSPQMGDKYSVIYAIYTLVGLNRVHHVYDSPSEVFQSPYDKTIEQLFDGDHPGQEIVENTPEKLDQLLTPAGYALLRTPTGGLAEALKVVDGVCTGWVPAAPARLYMATDDEQAVNANTDHCRTSFAASGAKVPVVDLGTPENQGSRHLGSNSAGTARIVTWFAQLSH